MLLKDLDGHNHQLSTLMEDKTIAIIDFWATWCVPCLWVHKDMGEVYEENKYVSDAIFIAINFEEVER